jgi:hypothetical protein
MNLTTSDGIQTIDNNAWQTRIRVLERLIKHS